MIKEHTSRFIYGTFLVIATLLLWTGDSVHADSALNSGSQISIASNGQTMIKGATVISVEGLTIVVSTTWGATQLTWSVETTGSTKFTPAGSSRDSLQAIKKGDVVNVTGMLAAELSHATLRASAVRNLSLAERLAPAQEIEVEAQALPGIPSTGARDVPLSSGAGDNSLAVAATSTALLSWLWRYLYGDPAVFALR